MVFIHEDTMVVLTTGVTTTSWMFSVLANATVTCGDVTALLAVVV